MSDWHHTEPLDLCRDCGHVRSLHWMGLGQPGTCQATVDRRHPATGGDTLTPCGCKGFLPSFRWLNRGSP